MQRYYFLNFQIWAPYLFTLMTVYFITYK